MFLFDRPYVAFDFETTGLDAGIERIVEIGAVKFDQKGEIDRFSALVNPGKPIDYRITVINGISNEMVANAPNENVLLPKLLRFLGDAVLLAHNAPFDMAFLKNACTRTGHTCPSFFVLDTLEIARKLYPNKKSFALQNLGTDFGLDRGKSHRALDDSLLCMQLFFLMAKELRHDWENPENILEWLKKADPAFS